MTKPTAPTAEDVIVQKLRRAKLGKREKDMLDALGILKVRQHKLDWPYIEKWGGELKLLDALTEARNRAGI